MRTKLLVAIALPLLATIAPAQCRNLVFPGSIPPSPWTAAGSPYCVVADVTIAAPLVIQAGTVIEVQGLHAVTMAATLTVTGTASQPVRMARGGSATRWKGLVLQRAGTVIEHLHLSDASDSGIHIQAADVTLRQCVITHCTGPTGAGVRVAPPTGSTGNVTLENCSVTDNDATSHGGGLYVDAPATTHLLVSDSLFARNRCNPAQANGSYYGGGAFIAGVGTVALTRTTVRDNRVVAFCNGYNCSVTGGGGGVYTAGLATVIRSCSFTSNSIRVYAPGGAAGNYTYAYAYGGGLQVAAAVATLTVANSVFACNSISTTGYYRRPYGAGISTGSNDATLSHASLYNNTGATGSNLYVAAGTLVGDHCIAFSRAGTAGHGIAGTATFAYSDIEGGYAGTGNFSATPGFADPAGCDCAALALGSGSGVMDMGDPQPSANDARRPPASGTARADVGHLGGSANDSWLRPAGPFDLAMVPPYLDRGWGASPIYTVLDGGEPGDAAAVLLTGYDNTTPIGPLWFNDLFGIVCPDRISMRQLALPLAPIGLQSLEFTGVTLRNGALLFTPQRSLALR